VEVYLFHEGPDVEVVAEAGVHPDCSSSSSQIIGCSWTLQHYGSTGSLPTRTITCALSIHRSQEVRQFDAWETLQDASAVGTAFIAGDE
jgi:hypothetical protein